MYARRSGDGIPRPFGQHADTVHIDDNLARSRDDIERGTPLGLERPIKLQHIPVRSIGSSLNFAAFDAVGAVPAIPVQTMFPTFGGENPSAVPMFRILQANTLFLTPCRPSSVR